jgi:hypothetical protein
MSVKIKEEDAGMLNYAIQSRGSGGVEDSTPFYFLMIPIY